MSNKENLSFEEALKRLEKIVSSLESGSAPLEESIKLFEEGVKLIGICHNLLEKTEQNVSLLLKSDKIVQQIPFKEEEKSNGF